MHLTLQILRKDIERLWQPVLLALVLLAYWAYQEATRAPVDWSNPAPHGVWLNMALPFAWSLLIALVIHQDSLVGDRQFWVALPCGWRPLLAAKAIFILLTIQIPYFFASAVILIARGFNPALHLPHLFWKQLVLLGLIVPAVAVAATVKHMAQFMLVLITLASAIVLFSARLNSGSQSDETWDVRWVLTVLILGTGALAVALLQFARRYTIRSRAIGVVTALAAASLYSWLPRDTSAAIDVAFSPVQRARAPVSLQLAPREPDYHTQQRWYNFQRTTILIPVAFPGLPAEFFTPDSYVHLDQISFELILANGERYESQYSPGGYQKNRIDVRLEDSWQALEFYNPALWSRASSGPVAIHGRILARLYRIGSNRTILRAGERADIPGLGRCSSSSSEESPAALRKLSVLECDSVELLSRNISFWFDRDSPHFGTLRERTFFGISFYPQDPWLSPLHHGASFAVAGDFPTAWTVAPQTQFDTVIIDYTIPGLDLNRFVVQKPVKPEAGK